MAKLGKLRTVFANLLYLGALRGLDLLLPLITLPYIVRTVGLDNYGHIAMALALTSYFAALIQYGFSISAVREVARGRENPARLSNVFSSYFTTTVFLVGVSAVIFSFALALVPQFQNQLVLQVGAFINVALQSAFPLWLFQGLERMKGIVVVSAIGKLLYLCSLFVFVRDEADYILVPYLNVLASLTILVLGLFIAVRTFSLQFKLAGIKDVLVVLREGRHAFVVNFAPNLYNSSTTLILGLSAAPGIVGAYSAAVRLVSAVMMFGTVVTSAFLPYLARSLRHHARYASAMAILGLLVTMILVIFAQPASLFLTGEIESVAALFIQLLAPWVFFVFVRNSVGNNYLMLIDDESAYQGIVMWVSLTSLFIALLVIPLYGGIGATMVVVGSAAVMAMATFARYLNRKTRY